MVYENAFGKIPEGFIVHHKDENTENNSLANLEMTTQHEHNVIHYPKRFANGFDGTCPNHKVVAIRQAGNEDVFNGCVDDAHSYIVVDPKPVAGIMSGIVSANCGEIILRPFGFCNLSEVVVRSTDTFADLQRKVQIAAIIGTFQSTLTDFKYIRKQWRVNAEEERLLGVSMTGIMDHPMLNGGMENDAGYCNMFCGDEDATLSTTLQRLKLKAIDTNKEWAERLGIPQSAAITTVKPSGTVSQLVDAASGIHPRHNPYYVRTVRADCKDPLAKFMQEQGVPNEPDVTNPNNLVFSFPMKAPEGCLTRNDRNAIEALEHYLVFQKYWCEHNPSITVYVKEHEWLEVGAWVYKNLGDLGGVSFLPHSDHVYQQAPYQDITAEEYEALKASFPSIDWKLFDSYETSDTTTTTHELACSAGQCEI
jgi:ribonucleoside-diphosphate reductase alpha chain